MHRSILNSRQYTILGYDFLRQRRFNSPSTKDMKQSVGVIGLGQMGEKIAINLQKDGYQVFVFDKQTQLQMNLNKNFSGITMVDSIDGMTKSCSTVISILPNDSIVQDVSIQLLSSKSDLSDLCHISCSTVSPSLSRSLAYLYNNKSAHFIAAPVFARPDSLSKRQSTWVISGGDAVKRQEASSILSKLGNTVDYGDDAGAANVVKLCGNFLIASSIEAIAECSAFAEKSGVDRVEVMKLMSSTIFDCLIYKGYGERVTTRDHRPGGFSLELGLKDMSLVSKAAREVDVPMPFLSLLLDRYTSSKAKGRGNMDWSAIGLDVSETAGINVIEDLEINDQDVKNNNKYN